MTRRRVWSKRVEEGLRHVRCFRAVRGVVIRRDVLGVWSACSQVDVSGVVKRGECGDQERVCHGCGQERGVW